MRSANDSGADERVPRPGRPVRGSDTGRPMMAALDLLGRRWTLRVIWELRHGPVGFRELRLRADAMSSSVLADRLRELTEVGIVTTDADGVYRLTELGEALRPSLEPLSAWAQRWAAELSTRQEDAD
ncbi:helix-turn-helix domain-containing protein [Streptomyces sp. NPDC046909]|uniref:winged helix-turn-helix transcriptional regulator n=1 Tax=Streptomyces sp. NPDC046909 TaxID=3155617 RepID=UPI0033CCCAF8